MYEIYEESRKGIRMNIWDKADLYQHGDVHVMSMNDTKNTIYFCYRNYVQSSGIFVLNT